LSSKLGIYDFEDMRKMMAYDTIRMEKIGQEKTAVFVIISDTDRSMDGMANLFFSQTMQELCSYADNRCRGGRLPMNVRFILDDFATNCKINDFPRIISTIRSRGISAMLMIQAESQLTAGYGVEGNTIISNCDTYVYLGGNDIATAEAVAKRCNVALGRILYMPIGTNWIFRRGMYPINAENFELEPFEASCFEELQKENKDKTLEEQSRIA
jgi:type IV secretion system protein VirD4